MARLFLSFFVAEAIWLGDGQNPNAPTAEEKPMSEEDVRKAIGPWGKEGLFVKSKQERLKLGGPLVDGFIVYAEPESSKLKDVSFRIPEQEASFSKKSSRAQFGHPVSQNTVATEGKVQLVYPPNAEDRSRGHAIAMKGQSLGPESMAVKDVAGLGPAAPIRKIAAIQHNRDSAVGPYMIVSSGGIDKEGSSLIRSGDPKFEEKSIQARGSNEGTLFYTGQIVVDLKRADLLNSDNPILNEKCEPKARDHPDTKGIFKAQWVDAVLLDKASHNGDEFNVDDLNTCQMIKTQADALRARGNSNQGEERVEFVMAFQMPASQSNYGRQHSRNMEEDLRTWWKDNASGSPPPDIKKRQDAQGRTDGWDVIVREDISAKWRHQIDNSGGHEKTEKLAVAIQKLQENRNGFIAQTRDNNRNTQLVIKKRKISIRFRGSADKMPVWYRGGPAGDGDSKPDHCSQVLQRKLQEVVSGGGDGHDTTVYLVVSGAISVEKLMELVRKNSGNASGVGKWEQYLNQAWKTPYSTAIQKVKFLEKPFDITHVSASENWENLALPPKDEERYLVNMDRGSPGGPLSDMLEHVPQSACFSGQQNRNRQNANSQNCQISTNFASNLWTLLGAQTTTLSEELLLSFEHHNWKLWTIEHLGMQNGALFIKERSLKDDDAPRDMTTQINTVGSFFGANTEFESIRGGSVQPAATNPFNTDLNSQMMNAQWLSTIHPESVFVPPTAQIPGTQAPGMATVNTFGMPTMTNGVAPTNLPLTTGYQPTNQATFGTAAAGLTFNTTLNTNGVNPNLPYTNQPSTYPAFANPLGETWQTVQTPNTSQVPIFNINSAMPSFPTVTDGQSTWQSTANLGTLSQMPSSFQETYFQSSVPPSPDSTIEIVPGGKYATEGNTRTKTKKKKNNRRKYHKTPSYLKTQYVYPMMAM